MLFFQVKSAAEARRLLDPEPRTPGAETVALAQAAGRIVSADVTSPISLPEFRRAVVDGYAVQAADTFGASPGLPAYLQLVGEVLMGQGAATPVGAGQAVKIATGGMLPDGADAVVMVEYTDPVGEGLVEITRPAAPGEQLVEIGDDIQAGAVLVPRGRRLGPAEIGALAGVGILALPVYRRPRVAVVPTGDEIVAPTETPAPGEVRDINTSALCAAVQLHGAEPLPYPIVRDDPGALRTILTDALHQADLVLIAGGSSVGTRDWTLEVLLELPGAELLLHGVSIRPGKPVIGVQLGDRLLVGLPGNPVSALVVFDQFVRPHLRRLTGELSSLPTGSRVQARLTRSYRSDPGKEDYVRVRVSRRADGTYDAEPLLGKSTLLRTLVEADGFLVVPEQVEGLEEGESVEVRVVD